MKQLRLRRLLNGKNKILTTPLDHGVTLGPVPGIIDIRSTVEKLINTNIINSVILHRGNVIKCGDIVGRSTNMSIILHLSASIGFSPNNNHKVLVATVEDGLRLGADAVSMHVNIGNINDKDMLKDLGKVSAECEKWRMPLLAMMYPRGDGVNEKSPESNMVAARVAMELGADIIKLNYTGDKESFAKVVDGVNVPVIVAGGSYKDDETELFRETRDALDAGAAGISIGRNVFQRLENGKFIQALGTLVNDGISAEEAMLMAKGEEYTYSRYEFSNMAKQPIQDCTL